MIKIGFPLALIMMSKIIDCHTHYMITVTLAITLIQFLILKLKLAETTLLIVSLINKLADYTFTDAEIFTQAFNAVDTNSVSLDFFIR